MGKNSAREMLATDPGVQAVAGLLRRLGAAVKATAFYAPGHPVTEQAVAELHHALTTHLDAHGPLSVRVAKKALVVEGFPFQGGTHESLAFAFYTRRVAAFVITPAIEPDEVAAFVSIVGRDRRSLDAAGGVSDLIAEAGIEHIQVLEVAARHDAPLQPPGQPLAEMLGLEWLTPQEREHVFEMLRAGSDGPGRLFESLIPPGDEVGIDAQVERLYQALRNLDRCILDQPAEDQQDLSLQVVEGLLRLPEPLRMALDRVLLMRAAEDPAAGVLVSLFSSDRIAQAILGMLSHGDIAEQIAAMLMGTHISREKAGQVLAALGARLRPDGQPPTWLTSAVWPRLQTNRALLTGQSVRDFAVDERQLTISDEEFAACLREARAVDDDAVTRAVSRTLLDVLRSEDDRRELVDTARALEAHIPGLIASGEFALLAEILEGITGMATSASPSQREIGGRIVQAVTCSRNIEALADALWNGREGKGEAHIRACLDSLGDSVVRPFIGMLGQEPLAGKRHMICDLLVAAGRERLNEFRRSTSDPRWYLVRNIANVLGRLGNPDAADILGRLATHAEYRVRREAVDALARIGTENAQERLARFLDDADPRIPLRVLHVLTSAGVRQATPWLRNLLRRSDWLNRQFEIRQAALVAIARFGGRDALPAVQRLARRGLSLGERGREIRRLAARAEASIRARYSDPVRAPALAADGRAP